MRATLDRHPRAAIARTGTAAFPAACLVLVAIAMLAVLFASSRWGIGVLPDSTVYVGSARTLLSTGQLEALDADGRPVPWVHTAPFLPAILAAAAALFRIDPLAAARGLCTVCFGFTVGLMGWVAWRWLGSAWLGVLAAVMTLVATSMIDIYTAALSEPLYVVLAMGALVLLAEHLESSSDARLVAAAVLSALAILTRYAGASLLAAEGLVLLFLPRNRPFLTRVRDLSIYSVLSAAPIVAWLLRNRIATGHSITATVSLNHLTAAAAPAIAGVPGVRPIPLFAGLIPGYFSWLFPGAVPSSIRIAGTILLVLLAVTAVLLMSRTREDAGGPDSPASPSSGLTAVLLAYVGCHLGVIVVARFFLYSDIVMDDRNLLPTLCPLILLLLWSLKRTVEFGRMRLAWIPAALIVVAFVATNAPRSASHLLQRAKEGRGYASEEWEGSRVIQQLKTLPPNTPVYATLPSAVRFLTGVPARLLPIPFDYRGGVANANYQHELERMRREAGESGIAVAFVGGYLGRLKDRQEIQDSLGLIPAAQDSTGSLFWSPSFSAAPSLSGSR